MKNLRCGNCNAENYFPRIGKRKMRRRHLKHLQSLADNIADHSECARYLI